MERRIKKKNPPLAVTCTQLVLPQKQVNPTINIIKQVSRENVAS